MALCIPPVQSQSFFGGFCDYRNDAPVTLLRNPCEQCVTRTSSHPRMATKAAPDLQNLLICCLPLSDSALTMEAKVLSGGNFVALACLLHSWDGFGGGGAAAVAGGPYERGSAVQQSHEDSLTSTWERKKSNFRCVNKDLERRLQM